MTAPATASVVTAVVIPARDNADRIGGILGALPGTLAHRVVVDGGSVDRTREEAAAAGATVVNLPAGSERGYGACCRAGLEYLFSLPEDRRPQVVAFFAAWDDVRAEQLRRVIDPIVGGHIDLAVGSRHIRRPPPGKRHVLSRLSAPLLRVFFAKGHTDIGPMRAIRADCLRKMELTTTGRGWDIEMRAHALWDRLTILEVPTDYAVERPKNRPSEVPSLAWTLLRTGPRTAMRRWMYNAYVTLRPGAAKPRRRGEWG